MLVHTMGIMLIGQAAGLSPGTGDVVLAMETATLRVDVNAQGRVAALRDRASGKEYLAPGQPAPLVSLVVDGAVRAPTAAEYDAAAQELLLTYGDVGRAARVAVAAKPTHVTLTLASLAGGPPHDAVWGPYPTTIGETVGETVGVVRDGAFAIGIQALNGKTIGGVVSQHGAQVGRGNTASRTDFGSVIGAYTPEAEGGVVGSSVALFGCKAADALVTIGEIEIVEGLPHPMLNGVWAKVSPDATLSYLITPFGDGDIEQVLARANEAGLRYIYHPGPFRTWGHFELNPGEFPDGDASLKRCVDKAEAEGIGVGVHTLTAFITTNDPYVTPVPDARLARWGSSTLSGDIDEAATEIAVESPDAFRDRGTLAAVIVGSELLQYESVTDAEPWTLKGCKRGAFGTKASAHSAGDDIGHLADHAYRTLFPGIGNGMMEEMTRRLVELFDTTGLRQISFDGLEGLSQYGWGEYPRNLFVKQCYDGWNREVINDASNLLHYLWHIHTRMNWGEPWGKSTREGMPEYRFQNQDYFERNLFPKMLGWFQLRLASRDVEATALDDMEWVLSKAAGYDAGFALSTSPGEMSGNGQTPAVLAAVKAWEAARHEGAFSGEQMARLRDGKSEWHLEPDGAAAWRLQPARFACLEASGERLQPGQPPVSEWELDNPYGEQPFTFVLRVLASDDASASIDQPSISVGGREVTFHTTLKPQQYLVCEGTREAKVCDANWNVLAIVAADTDLPTVAAGKQTVTFASVATGGTLPQTTITVRLYGDAERVGR